MSAPGSLLQAARLRVWLDDVQLSARLGTPQYANPSELKDDLRVVLDTLDRYHEALAYIGHFAEDSGYMQTAKTLHYDMAGKANEALTGLLQSRMPGRETRENTSPLHDGRASGNPACVTSL